MEDIRVPGSMAWYKCKELVAAGAGGNEAVGDTTLCCS